MEYRLAFGLAKIANIMVALWSKKQSGHKPMTPHDFMPTVTNNKTQTGPDDSSLTQRIKSALGMVAPIEHSEGSGPEAQD